MSDALTQAIASADRQDWTETLNRLQQLPLRFSPEAGSRMGDHERQLAIELALKVLQFGDFHQRWEIAKVIPYWGEQSLAPLLAMANSDRTDAETQWFISRILSQINHPASICTLVQLVQQTDDDDLSAMAAESLAQMGSPAIASLAALLADDRYRFLAVKALAQIRNLDTLEPLLSVISDPDPAMRAIAIEALGSFKSDRLMPILIQALQDPAAVVRQEAASALGVRGKQGDDQGSLAQSLQPLLWDPFPQVSRQAAIALGRLGTIGAAEILYPVLKSPATPLDLKITIVRSLGWIEHSLALDYLGIALRWSDRLVCQAIIQSLGSQQNPELKAIATQILLQFLTSGQQASQDPEIRQSLVMALGELGDPTAIPYLHPLTQDPNPQVRLHAQAALRKT